MSDILEKAIARDLLSIGAVFLRPEQPFTWASGIHSPIYCDNRLILSAPAVRDRVEAGLAELVRTYYPDCQMLMGTSTAGIAHAALAAQILDLPMGYVRGENKSHGRTNRIEGRLEPGTKTVVVIRCPSLCRLRSAPQINYISLYPFCANNTRTLFIKLL